MKNKFCLVFSLLLIVSGSVWAQKPKDIPLTVNPDDTLSVPKSIIICPTATLDGTILTFDFPEATVSQVIISDPNTNAILYSESFASTTEVVVDLEDEGISEGSYTLWLFAFGKWWWGEFVIEEE
ncbi:MAG: DUF3244 domain-containing protein [Bacteroidaceae bacterium]|nr:DUF3244 domain-containing protein [Bacteroidaceae bacterium]